MKKLLFLISLISSINLFSQQVNIESFTKDFEKKEGFINYYWDDNNVVTPSLAKRVKQVLEDESLRQQIVDHNYEVARQFYSYSVVRSNLRAFISSFTGY